MGATLPRPFECAAVSAVRLLTVVFTAQVLRLQFYWPVLPGAKAGLDVLHIGQSATEDPDYTEDARQ